LSEQTVEIEEEFEGEREATGTRGKLLAGAGLSSEANPISGIDSTRAGFLDYAKK